MASPRGVSLTHDPGTVAATLASAVTTANKNPPEGYGPQWTASSAVKLYGEVFAALSKETTGEPNP